MALHEREYMRGPQPSRWLDVIFPDAVTTLVVINVLVFIFQHVLGIGVTRHGSDYEWWGAFSLKALQEGRVWTIVTYMFVHDSIFHILGNCLMIYFAGKALQSLLGAKHFLYVYFLSGLVGAVLECTMGWLMRDSHPMVGASACAVGVFMALAVVLPQEVVTTLIYFIVPLRMRLWTMAMALVGVSVVLAILQVTKVWDMQVAHFAHLGGALAGWWYMRMLGYGGRPVTYDRLWHERKQRDQGREFAGAGVPKPRRRDRIVDVPVKEVSAASSPLSTKEFIEREIDPLLEKIAAHGIHSLTESERLLLEKASKEILGKENR